MIRILRALLALVLVSATLYAGSGENRPQRFTDRLRLLGYVQYVDPFIGTGGNGHTYPGATVPFGMVQLSPNSGRRGWEWCSGYRYADSSLLGFAHTHLSGTGCTDLGDILVTPTISSRSYAEDYRSPFSHDRENAYPGYYSVDLLDHNIRVELTATARAGFHRYTFPASDSARVILNLAYGQEDTPYDTYLHVIGDTLVVGHRFSQGWARDQKVFFAAKFSKAIRGWHVLGTSGPGPAEGSHRGKSLKGVFAVDARTGLQLLLKVGISPVSIEGAIRNLDAEIPRWDFDGVRADAAAAWDQALRRIRVESDEPALLKIFYSAMYHTMLAPTLYGDVDGAYRGPDDSIHYAEGFENYSTFSLWDTFRAAHPLFTLIHPERVNDMVRSMMAFYKEGGRLPVWPLAGNETDCMIGYHSVPVMTEALLKGLTRVGPEELLMAMRRSAFGNTAGLQYYNLQPPSQVGSAPAGILPSDITVESSVRAEGTVMSGYARTVAGQSMAYSSSNPRARQALICRAVPGSAPIEWETAVVPEGDSSDAYVFVWIAGLSSQRTPHRFDLLVDGNQVLSFSAAQAVHDRSVTLAEEGGRTLTFYPQVVDRHGDLFGTMMLRLPSSDVRRGHPVRLQVIGDQGDNPNWLMTFEYLLRDTVVASNVFGRRVIEGRDVQFVRVEMEHLGPPHPVDVRLGEEITTATVRNTGHTIAYLAVPAVQHEDTVLVRIAAGDSILGQVNLTLRPVRSPGYIPADGEPESVSKTLEYAYDDWCIAQVARVAGAKEDEQRFLERAGYYRNVFDSTTGFMRGRMLDGSWVTPFNPRFATQKQPEFTEGNAWQYTWSIQHDIRGLMQLMGGREQFVRMLDSLFEQSSDLTGTGAPPDVSGMIGMYAHGNEPSHHIAYLYAYAGQPWKTQEMVSRIMRTMYSAAPDGIIGNEDCGQMSAWFVLSALGFYPVDPVSLTYVIGSPLFEKAVVELGKGVTLTVNAFGTSDVRKYIRYIERGGRRHERVYLTHDELLQGGILHFTMDSRPDVTFGREEGSLPPSMTPPQAPTTPSGELR